MRVRPRVPARVGPPWGVVVVAAFMGLVRKRTQLLPLLRPLHTCVSCPQWSPAFPSVPMLAVAVAGGLCALAFPSGGQLCHPSGVATINPQGRGLWRSEGSCARELTSRRGACANPALRKRRRVVERLDGVCTVPPRCAREEARVRVPIFFTQRAEDRLHTIEVRRRARRPRGGQTSENKQGKRPSRTGMVCMEGQKALEDRHGLHGRVQLMALVLVATLSRTRVSS